MQRQRQLEQAAAAARFQLELGLADRHALVAAANLADVDRQLDACAAFLRGKRDRVPAVGLVLGSGLGAFAERLKNRLAIPYEEIPHFPVPSGVVGHAGELVLGDVVAGAGDGEDPRREYGEHPDGFETRRAHGERATRQGRARIREAYTDPELWRRLSEGAQAYAGEELALAGWNDRLRDMLWMIGVLAD